MDFFLQADSLFCPLVRFVFFKSVTAGYERNTVHDKYTAVVLFFSFYAVCFLALDAAKSYTPDF